MDRRALANRIHGAFWLEGLAAVAAVGFLLAWWDAPLVEDALFWWVPKALLVAENGLTLQLSGALPTVMTHGGPLPPQWAGGLPDYAHPPLWYWWLGAVMAIAGPTLDAVRLACLPLVGAVGAGSVALSRRIGRPWAGFAPLCMPPLLAQLLRPELDLPLLALSIWSLVALLSGRWGLFAVLSVLATGCKEPGVLLCVPALVRVVQERRWKLVPVALAPLWTLGLWAVVHGGLASAERLPDSVALWLTADLPAMLRLVFWEQARGLWVVGGVGAVLGMARKDRLSWALVVSFGLAWLLFFSVVGFRLQPHNPAPLTHVRYFGPAFVVFAILASARWPFVALPGLWFLHQPSVFGPEGSLFGIDAGRAEAAAAPWIAEQVKAGKRVWVGSYHAAALGQVWAGHPGAPVDGVQVYAIDTDPHALQVGDIVLFAAYGEPGGPLQRSWSFSGVRTWSAGAAVVQAAEVIGPPGR